LAWDPSSATNVTGYNLYYGPSGGSTNMVHVGNVTSDVLSGLIAGQNYFSYVTAVLDGGLESPPSNLLTFTAATGPVLAGIGDKTVIAGNALTVQLSATDPTPAAVLTYGLVSGPSGAAVNAATGLFNWTPTRSQAPSTNAVTVQVTDNSSPPLSATASFNVIVMVPNNPPSLAAVPNQTVGAGSLVTVPLSATDPDLGQLLTFTLVAGPAGAAVNPSTGVFTWTASTVPSTNSVTVQVTDNGIPNLSDSKSFNIIVITANTSPVLATVPNLLGTPGSAVTWQLSATDADTPAQKLTYSLVSGPTGASVNASSGLFSWTPTSSQVGSAAITVAVTDNGVPPLSNSKSFTVVVSSANTAPVLAPVPNQATSPGTPLSIQLSASDSDIPAQTLTCSLVSGPAGATVSSTGLFSWTPTTAQSPSTNVVTVKVTDSGTPALSATQSFTVVVSSANTPPQLYQVGTRSVAPGSNVSFQITATDSDVPAQTLTFSLVAAPAGASITPSGVFSWTPTTAQAGTTNQITAKVTDNGSPAMSASTTFTVVVNGLSNTGPTLAVVGTQTVAAGANLSLQLSATDSDVPAQTLTYSLVSGPAGSSVTPSGLFSWTPTTAQAPSTNTVTVKVSDSGTPAMSDSKSFTVVVSATSPSNTAPVLATVGNRTVAAGSNLSLQLSATDSDVPAQTLTYSLVSGPSGATVSSSGLFSWTPTSAQAPSTNSITVKVTDSGSPPLSSSQTFLVVVTAATTANTAPVLMQVGTRMVTPGQTVSFQLTGVDSDVPAQTLTFSLVSGPAGATVTPSGMFSWTPSTSQPVGTNVITAKVTDSGTPPLSDTKSFNIVVAQAGNLPPALNPIPDQTVMPGQILMLALTASDPNPGQKLTFGLNYGPSGVTVDPNTGIFTWRLSKTVVPATYAVTVTVSDSGSPPLSASQSFHIIVKSSTSSTAGLANLPTVSWVSELDESHGLRFVNPLDSRTESGSWVHYLEASEDLVHWVTVGVVSDRDELHDSAALGAQRRFYRIRSEATGGSGSNQQTVLGATN
jgi:hypothetical protein